MPDRISFKDAVTQSNKPKYDRIVACRYCKEPNLMFDLSKNGNPWLYSVSEELTPDEVQWTKDTKPGLAKNIREVAVGRDQDGKLVTALHMVMKNMPHGACRLESEAHNEVDRVTESAEVGTVNVSVGADGNVIEAEVDESRAQEYDGDAEPETAEELGFKVLED